MFLANNWWMFLIRGIFAIIFGIVALIMPQVTFLSLVLIFGAFAMVDGVFALVSAFTSNAKSENWWWIILGGILGIIIGLLTLFQPASMATAMLLLIAAWALATGFFEIVTAIRLRKIISGEFWMILSGLVSILFGILVLVYPASGAFAVGFIIGIWALIFGFSMVMFSFGLRRFRNTAMSEPNAV